MKFSPIVLLLFGMLGCGSQSATLTQEQAIAAIEEWGGKVTIDEKSPDKPVISVDLSRTEVTDDELKLLKGLTKLQTLILNDTNVTDKGLEHLEGLTNLDWIQVGPNITNEGVGKLQTALPKCFILR